MLSFSFDMAHALNDLLLVFSIQMDKTCRVSPHANDQMSVLIRILQGTAKLLHVGYVSLEDMTAFFPPKQA